MRAMRAERFGSYSIPITSAAMPCLHRLKSTLRYFCLWPPPICREVSRPLLLRPPVFFFGSRRLLIGRDLVNSWKVESDLKRSVGVNGRKVLRAIAKFVCAQLCHPERSEGPHFPPCGTLSGRPCRYSVSEVLRRLRGSG